MLIRRRNASGRAYTTARGMAIWTSHGVRGIAAFGAQHLTRHRIAIFDGPSSRLQRRRLHGELSGSRGPQLVPGIGEVEIDARTHDLP